MSGQGETDGEPPAKRPRSDSAEGPGSVPVSSPKLPLTVPQATEELGKS